MWGCMFSVYPFLLWWLREYIYIYILCLIIIIETEVWTITHCLGLGHETMVSAVCLSIFLCNWLTTIKNQWFQNWTAEIGCIVDGLTMTMTMNMFLLPCNTYMIDTTNHIHKNSSSLLSFGTKIHYNCTWQKGLEAVAYVPQYLLYKVIV